jgi:hypothetical protein
LSGENHFISAEKNTNLEIPGAFDKNEAEKTSYIILLEQFKPKLCDSRCNSEYSGSYVE